MPSVSGGEWIGAGALGGSWNASKVVLTGGVRVDANVFAGAPADNPAIDRTFGQSNDHAPNTIGVSPRLGFKRYYKSRRGTSSTGTGISTLNYGGPQIRGGIGEFRGVLPSALLSDAIASTGLPGGTQRLLCTGAAAPVPDWQAYQNDLDDVPRTCVGGASAFADTAPSVTMFDRAYEPLHTWRATAGWTNTIFNTYFTIDGLYILARNQPGTIDLNFAGAQRFSLASEGGRPVYVDPSSIVASTGAVSPVQSRVSSAFGRVADRVSDLNGDTRQITLYAIPPLPFRVGVFTFAYTYADSRNQSRGFDQTTAGDPRRVEWADATFTPRHQFIVQGAHLFRNGTLGLTMSARAVSGYRFTPTVSGDINGDGSYNDRAFVFNPASAPDTGVAHGLRELLASGSSSARNCLQKQLGAIAGRNSCVGPWTATMNASFIIQPPIPRTDNRAHVSLNFANPLGGLDQLLHGSDRLHGWGATPFIDGSLYQVRGFDPVAQRFLYTVNSRFGSTSPATSTFRTPFRVTLDFRFDLGHSSEEQALALNLRILPPLAGTRAPADSVKKRYMTAGSNGFSDIYEIMFHYADSLALSRDQTEKMEARRIELRARADSIYSDLASYLVALPPSYDGPAAVKRITAAGDAMWKVVYAEAPFLRTLLTPGQIRILPGGVREMVIVPNYQGRFFYGF